MRLALVVTAMSLVALPTHAGEGDLDDDGVPDLRDRCPGTAREFRDSVDTRGCPAPLVVVTERRVEHRARIFFRISTAEIRPVSELVLDAVAIALRARPQLEVEVQGHTDSRGRRDFNLKLSQDRADAVRRALIARGVDGKRLTARGYGETRPRNPCCGMASLRANTCPQGRSYNRRIEFLILRGAPARK